MAAPLRTMPKIQSLRVHYFRSRLLTHSLIYCNAFSQRYGLHTSSVKGSKNDDGGSLLKRTGQKILSIFSSRFETKQESEAAKFETEQESEAAKFETEQESEAAKFETEQESEAAKFETEQESEAVSQEKAEKSDNQGQTTSLDVAHKNESTTTASNEIQKQSEDTSRKLYDEENISRQRNVQEDLGSLITPLSFDEIATEDKFGPELVGDIDKGKILELLESFYNQPFLEEIGKDCGLSDKMFTECKYSFLNACFSKTEQLPTDLYIKLKDIVENHEGSHRDDLLPYFLDYSKKIYPHVNSLTTLKEISNLSYPPNMFPEARKLNRKIIINAGPTNSGKTFHALKAFYEAENGVYCSPLRLLASEVYQKSQTAGISCDLVTGEERKYANKDETSSSHVACTVEMASVNTPYDVAVIDEIQMISDPGRGWAWTRAVLGICAKEVHVCGEASAIPLIKDMAIACGDTVEVIEHKRKTSLTILDQAVGSFKGIQAGDCIVCFSKAELYNIVQKLDDLGKQCALIYGSLPPATKLAQAAKFNDPNDPCNILVATDAIGMGLNLCIKRIVLYAIKKPNLDENGILKKSYLTASQCLQIAGRAGRYGTMYQEGEATTFFHADLKKFKSIIGEEIPPLEKAGLAPETEQVELFSYHVAPNSKLSDIMRIFKVVSTFNESRYQTSEPESFYMLADKIEHLPLSLKTRYTYSKAPVDNKCELVVSMFVKYAQSHSREKPIFATDFSEDIGWPLTQPKTVEELQHLEAVFDAMDLYLWLGQRYPEMYPDQPTVIAIQQKISNLINNSLESFSSMIKKEEKTVALNLDRDKIRDIDLDVALQPSKKRSLHSRKKSHDMGISPHAGNLTRKTLKWVKPLHRNERKVNKHQENVNFSKQELPLVSKKQGLADEDISLEDLLKDYKKQSKVSNRTSDFVTRMVSAKRDNRNKCPRDAIQKRLSRFNASHLEADEKTGLPSMQSTGSSIKKELASGKTGEKSVQAFKLENFVQSFVFGDQKSQMMTKRSDSCSERVKNQIEEKADNSQDTVDKGALCDSNDRFSDHLEKEDTELLSKFSDSSYYDMNLEKSGDNSGAFSSSTRDHSNFRTSNGNESDLVETSTPPSDSPLKSWKEDVWGEIGTVRTPADRDRLEISRTLTDMKDGENWMPSSVNGSMETVSVNEGNVAEKNETDIYNMNNDVIETNRKNGCKKQSHPGYYSEIGEEYSASKNWKDELQTNSWVCDGTLVSDEREISLQNSNVSHWNNSEKTEGSVSNQMIDAFEQRTKNSKFKHMEGMNGEQIEALNQEKHQLLEGEEYNDQQNQSLDSNAEESNGNSFDSTSFGANEGEIDDQSKLGQFSVHRFLSEVQKGVFTKGNSVPKRNKKSYSTWSRNVHPLKELASLNTASNFSIGSSSVFESVYFVNSLSKRLSSSAANKIKPFNFGSPLQKRPSLSQHSCCSFAACQSYVPTSCRNEDLSCDGFPRLQKCFQRNFCTNSTNKNFLASQNKVEENWEEDKMQPDILLFDESLKEMSDCKHRHSETSGISINPNTPLHNLIERLKDYFVCVKPKGLLPNFQTLIDAKILQEEKLLLFDNTNSWVDVTAMIDSVDSDTEQVLNSLRDSKGRMKYRGVLEVESIPLISSHGSTPERAKANTYRDAINLLRRKSVEEILQDIEKNYNLYKLKEITSKAVDEVDQTDKNALRTAIFNSLLQMNDIQSYTKEEKNDGIYDFTCVLHTKHLSCAGRGCSQTVASQRAQIALCNELIIHQWKKCNYNFYSVFKSLCSSVGIEINPVWIQHSQKSNVGVKFNVFQQEFLGKGETFEDAYENVSKKALSALFLRQNKELMFVMNNSLPSGTMISLNMLTSYIPVEPFSCSLLSQMKSIIFTHMSDFNAFEQHLPQKLENNVFIFGFYCADSVIPNSEFLQQLLTSGNLHLTLTTNSIDSELTMCLMLSRLDTVLKSNVDIYLFTKNNFLLEVEFQKKRFHHNIQVITYDEMYTYLPNVFYHFIHGCNFLRNWMDVDISKAEYKSEILEKTGFASIIPDPKLLSSKSRVYFIDFENIYFNVENATQKIEKIVQDSEFAWMFMGYNFLSSRLGKFANFKDKSRFCLYCECGGNKNSADYALMLEVGRQSVLLPPQVEFYILSNDATFAGIETELRFQGDLRPTTLFRWPWEIDSLLDQKQR